MIAGRPLRFLGVTMCAWIAMRVTVLWWPTDAMPAVVAAEAAPMRMPGAVPSAPKPGKSVVFWPIAHIVPPAHFTHKELPGHAGIRPSESAASPTATASPEIGILAGLPVPFRFQPERRTRSRFAGSFWLVARGGSGPAAGVLGTQLGGSQAGARLTYALTENRRFALAVRVSSPLGPGAQEAAFGLEWQPTHLPVRVIAEQRIALNGGRGGPTIGLVGGFGPKTIIAGIALEGYAQGGVIGRDGGEGFADGAARLAIPLAKLGDVRFDLGAAAWGAAQKGASRVDLGPSLVAHVPLGQQPVRLSLDWRQRIAGNAVPNSGLVFTLGTDF